MEQSREPTNKNRIQGEVAQGEWASNREALSATEPPRKSGGGAVKVAEPYPGSFRLAPERATSGDGARSQSVSTRYYDRMGVPKLAR